MTRTVKLFLQDEAPRIGAGLRLLEVREGEKWAHLTAPCGRTARLRIEVFDKIEEETEALAERLADPKKPRNVSRGKID